MLTNMISTMTDFLPESDDHGAVPQDMDETITYHSSSRRLADAAAARLEATPGHLAQAHVYACSAPGTTRWSQVAPSQAFDMHVTSRAVATSMTLLYGVDVYKEV